MHLDMHHAAFIDAKRYNHDGGPPANQQGNVRFLRKEEGARGCRRTGTWPADPTLARALFPVQQIVYSDGQSGPPIPCGPSREGLSMDTVSVARPPRHRGWVDGWMDGWARA
ncbi:hypothetical protein L249_2113, partial [Ophiocordyceps polyrhachis-furcata BCC 54312]